ncbi:hypothetical protein [Roseateles koreensis]|uniref:Uncharacterized protein n=1 Tax=Roseateles koreensis TaxID=2987526 RepID=A0ABT5KW09_9BURK|nr:hypothetical protein [Roseateles koreensis]MDC8787123.1 hypothetical protein [Roseateles koreensis]
MATYYQQQGGYLFYRDSATEATAALNVAIADYNATHYAVVDAAKSLFNLRKQVGEILVPHAAEFVDQIHDAPTEIRDVFTKFAHEFSAFSNVGHVVSKQIEQASFNNGRGEFVVAGASSVLGAGVALGGPPAAIAIATTFGTASTGAAISSLYGLALTNATMAWLGGGAIAAGGGGMAAGTAQLALAAPVGLGVAGAGITLSAGYHLYKNFKVARTARTRIESLAESKRLLDIARHQISEMLAATTSHASGLRILLTQFKEQVLPSISFRDWTGTQQAAVQSLTTHVQSLTWLLGWTLEKHDA